MPVPVAAAAAGLGPAGLALSIGSILGPLFGNLFGASKQASAAKKATDAQAAATTRAAELEKAAFDEQLSYLKDTDARDYRDFLVREARDRTDWEAGEQRKAPFRALADSSIRTLADYIRVPGMRPAQEVPVQQWMADPRPQSEFDAHRAAGIAAGQDMSWMDAQRPPVSNTMPVGGNLQMYAQMPPQGPSDQRMFISPQRRQARTLADYAR